MLTSFAVIFIAGLGLSSFFRRIKLPGLIGMLLAGILIGPYALNWIDGSVLDISADLRQTALIIILTRAGLALDLKDLRAVGRPAVLMCFIPAGFEILGMMLLAPRLLGISLLDAAVMGAVVGAVSPAVIVPKMLKLMQEGYGREHSIPQLLLAAASVDDVFVIVMFTSFLELGQGSSITIRKVLEIPLSILLGIVIGVLAGVGMYFLFRKIRVAGTERILLLISGSFLMLALEHTTEGFLPFSEMLAVMSIGAAVQMKSPSAAAELSGQYARIWTAAEVLLFVLVGASVDVSYAFKAGLPAVLLIILVLIFRMLGVFLCLLKTKLTKKERIFCMLSFLPKATVQAAIGGIPLAMGMAAGQMILTVAVLAILITG